MQVIVMTSDKYLWACRPFMWLWDRYFTPDISRNNVICGFTPPTFELSKKFKFYSIGKFEDYPFGKWSDALIRVLDNVADEVFMLMLEDYWLTRQVDTKAVEILYDYMLQFKYTVKIDLCADRLYAFGADLNYGTVSYIDLVKSMPGSPYHMSLMAGLWNRDLLKKVIIPGESPHDVEMVGTVRLSHTEALVLGTRQWPLRHTLAFRGQDASRLLLDDLNHSDVKEMRELGLYQRTTENNENHRKNL